MFKLRILINYTSRLVFFIFILISSFALAQADNNSIPSYKNKVYLIFDYKPLKNNAYYKYDGIGADVSIINIMNISCSYKFGEFYLLEDYKNDDLFIYFKKQKSEKKSHLVDFSIQHKFNNFTARASFNYALLDEGLEFNLYNIKTKQLILSAVSGYAGTKSSIINIAAKISTKYNIIDMLYVSPKINIAFTHKSAQLIHDDIDPATMNKTKDIKGKKECSNIFAISPEVALGINLALANNATLNPEVVFSYNHNINGNSKSSFNTNASISVNIDRYYLTLAVSSITSKNKDKAASMKIGINF